MASDLLFVEVRSVEVRADDAAEAELRPGAATAHADSRVLQEREGLLVAGDRAGRDDAGRAVTGVGADRRLERLDGAVHEVGVVAAVDMKVDKPGVDETTGRVDRRS